MATLPSELAPEELSGQEAYQQSSKHTTSRSEHEEVIASETDVICC